MINYEEQIFNNSKVDFNKIKSYGFKKEDSKFKYEQNIMNDTFKVEVLIDKLGNVQGKIIDLSLNEKYLNYRIADLNGSYVSEIKNIFKDILLDIRDNCFIKEDYSFKQTNRIVKLIKEVFNRTPEFKWEKYPRYAVFKNSKNNKWFGIIMNVDKEKLMPNIDGEVEIINVKLNPEEILELLKQKGFYPAYHMNKKYWISILLDDTLTDTLIMDIIKESYLLTNK